MTLHLQANPLTTCGSLREQESELTEQLSLKVLDKPEAPSLADRLPSVHLFAVDHDNFWDRLAFEIHRQSDMVALSARPSRIAKDDRRTKINIPSPALLKAIRMPGPGRELPMPTVTRITSLAQAHATLLHCCNRLSRFANESTPSTESPSTPSSDETDQERNRFQQWLEQWEVAFSSYLATAMASMVNEDITESRILKTNHLACTIMASGVNATTSKTFDADFSAILELSGAVLRSRHISEGLPTDELAEQRRVLRPGADLDVLHPLQLVCTYSSQEEARRRAAELLMGYGFRLRS